MTSILLKIEIIFNNFKKKMPPMPDAFPKLRTPKNVVK